MTNENRRPRILAGSPITAEKKYKRYCLIDYLERVRRLTYPGCETMLLINGEEGEEIERDYADLNITRIPSARLPVETVVYARNLLRRRVLEEGFDYLLFYEQDIVGPDNVIELLLERDKPVCSILYFNERTDTAGGKASFPMVWRFDPECLKAGEYRELRMSRADFTGRRLMRADVIGLGLVLIHRSVLEQLPFRFEQGDPPLFEEFTFGRDCHKLGIDMYLDAGIECHHHSPRGLETVKN